MENGLRKRHVLCIRPKSHCTALSLDGIACENIPRERKKSLSRKSLWTFSYRFSLLSFSNLPLSRLKLAHNVKIWPLQSSNRRVNNSSIRYFCIKNCRGLDSNQGPSSGVASDRCVQLYHNHCTRKKNWNQEISVDTFFIHFVSFLSNFIDSKIGSERKGLTTTSFWSLKFK